jgi:hypothetical protein
MSSDSMGCVPRTCWKNINIINVMELSERLSRLIGANHFHLGLKYGADHDEEKIRLV